MNDHPILAVLVPAAVERRFQLVVLNVSSQQVRRVSVRVGVSLHAPEDSTQLGSFSESIGDLPAGEHRVLLDGLGAGSGVWIRSEIAITLDDRRVLRYAAYFSVEEEIERRATYVEALRQDAWPLELREDHRS